MMALGGHDAFIQSLTTTALTMALAVTISLPLLQMDAISRKILSPDRLRAKRRKTQVYEMDKAVEIQRLRMRAVVQSLALSAKQEAKQNSDASSSARTNASGGNGTKVDGSTWRYQPKEDRLNTDLLSTKEEYDDLVKEILDKSKPSPVVVAIDTDEEDGLDKKEIYLWLAFPPTSGAASETKTDNGKEWRRLQVPLVPFATALADAFEDQITSTALCFVTDASSGLSASIFQDVFVKSGAGLAMIAQPSWMVYVARILQRKLIVKDNVSKIIFALARLDAWRVRDHVGSSRTVVFTLPGQSVTPTLLPVLYQAFPHERHVFAYDTCFESVSRGLVLRKTSVKLSGLMMPSIGGNGGEGNTLNKSNILQGTMPMPEWITSTAPVTQLRSIRKLGEALAELPAEQAGIVESWMASVDAFLQLKAEEKTNNYTPFVCRMGLIMGRTGLGNLASDRVDELNELALVNLMQYVTGSRSRPLKHEVVTAAKKVLEDAKARCEKEVEGYEFSREDRKLIEACCFLHHGILIGDKTLMDTVQPKKEWSLKAARKLQSCACCDPEEEDEESDDEIGATGGSESKEDGGKIDMSTPGAFAVGLNKRPAASAGTKKAGYVDATKTFAFDPANFS